jgi:sugar phosphate isomerase/epimerase
VSKLDVGVIVSLGRDPVQGIKTVAELGLRSCQIVSWNPQEWTAAAGKQLVEACAASGVRVSTFWSGYPGPAVWNFIDGPATIGLVPPQTRQMRVEVLKQAADFAAAHRLPSITTHLGFIPEDPHDPNFAPTVEAVRDIAAHCKTLGVGFWFETGQETPVTLLRLIERVGLDNVGINLDTANLILYGKANPVDALDVFGRFVRDTHIKDGCYPTDGEHLGKERPLGEGRVDFAAVIAKLKALGYTGPLTIEREIGGEKQLVDIRKAVALLEPLR